MACRMGDQDRLSRIVAGIILISFAAITENVLGWLGLIPLVTGVLRWCPLYAPFGIDTCNNEEKSNH